MPKVSIIVPIYNVEKYLDRCMGSLINQTLRDIEIIMVDDGSPDRCPQMCDEYARRDSRIKVIHKKNGGLGYARNSGLEIATGEYIAFVDSDDYVDVRMYEYMYHELEKYSVDAVICAFNSIYKNKVFPRVIPGFTMNNRIIDALGDYIPNYIGTLPGCTVEQLYGYSVWNVLYKHSIIKEHNIKFDSERVYVSEDILFNISYMSKVERILIYPKYMYNYCHNENSLTTKYKADRFDGIIRLWKEVCVRTFPLQEKLQQPISLNTDRLLLNKTLYTICDAIKALKIGEAENEVNKIIGNKELIKVLKDYPIQKMPLQLKMFYWLVKKQYAFVIVCMYDVKNLIKRIKS